MRFVLIALALCIAAPGVTGCDKKKDDASKDESSAKKKKSAGDDDEEKGKKKKSSDDDDGDKKKSSDDEDGDKKKGECDDPKEAKDQVAAGREAITDKPPRAKDAFKAYSKAIVLMDGGCKLGEKDQWDALEGAGIAALMTKRYEEGEKYLARAAKKWPGIPELRYNLACAHCRMDDVDGCYNELKAALEAAEAAKVPSWYKEPQDAAHYASISRKDDDLASLRKDKRFEKLVSKYE